MAEEKIGEVVHFFGDIEVAVMELDSGQLEVGDKIRIKGATTDEEVEIDSMEIDHESVEEAGAGDEVAVKIGTKARDGDEVFKIV